MRNPLRKPRLLASLLLPLALLPARAGAAETKPEPRSTMERWVEEFVSKLAREYRIELASHLPGIAGIRFLCQLQSGPAEKRTTRSVLPGDAVEAPEGAELQCPEHYRLSLGRGARLVVQQGRHGPVFLLESGSVAVEFNEEPLWLESRQFTFAAAGLTKQQRVLAFQSENGHGIICRKGQLTADYRTLSGDPGQHFLAAENCRVELSLNNSALRRYLNAEDRVQAANLALPRKHWPSVTLPARAADPANATPEIAASLTQKAGSAPPKPTDPYVLTWTLPSVSPGLLLPPGTSTAKCAVFAQKGDAELLTEVLKFDANGAEGQITLPADLRGAYLSLRCEQGDNVHFSNVALPQTPLIQM